MGRPSSSSGVNPIGLGWLPLKEFRLVHVHALVSQDLGPPVFQSFGVFFHLLAYLCSDFLAAAAHRRRWWAGVRARAPAIRWFRLRYDGPMHDSQASSRVRSSASDESCLRHRCLASATGQMRGGLPVFLSCSIPCSDERSRGARAFRPQFLRRDVVQRKTSTFVRSTKVEIVA